MATCSCTDPVKHAVGCPESTQYKIHRRMEVFRGATRLLASEHFHKFTVGVQFSATFSMAVNMANRIMDECEKQDGVVRGEASAWDAMGPSKTLRHEHVSENCPRCGFPRCAICHREMPTGGVMDFNCACSWPDPRVWMVAGQK